MKKKIILSVIAVILCVALLVCGLVLSDDGFSALESPQNAENLAGKIETAVSSKGSNTSKLFDSDYKTAWKASGKTDSIEITFTSPQTFNTIILREKGLNIQKFSFYSYVETPGNEHWECFYSQNTVQDYRMCAFDDVTTQKIKLEVSEADNTFKLREIEFYELEAKTRSDFRVSDYVIMTDLVNESFYDKNSDRYFAPENCEVVNQVHVIAAAKWNDNGELVISDGATPQQLIKIVKKLRAYFGDNEVDIFATVFFNACNPDTVFSEHKEEVIENTVDFLLKYGFDGVSYDWEYPTKAQWPVFSEHLVNLKKELSKHDLKLSCAFSAFNCGLTQDAIKALDQIEIMSYDNFDNDGNHSSFTSGAVQPVEYFLGLGFDAKQLNLGVPFYARPTDGSGVWIDYDDESYTPSDRFQNFSNGMWFNSAQMIQDKTAYAIEKDLGGMMIFTSTEDIDYNNELSLLKSMKNTIDERIVQK